MMQTLAFLIRSEYNNVHKIVFVKSDDKDMRCFYGSQRGKALAENFLARKTYLPPLNFDGEK
jgi:hypothetical protein